MAAETRGRGRPRLSDAEAAQRHRITAAKSRAYQRSFTRLKNENLERWQEIFAEEVTTALHEEGLPTK
jgi:hypothetical protein